MNTVVDEFLRIEYRCREEKHPAFSTLENPKYGIEHLTENCPGESRVSRFSLRMDRESQGNPRTHGGPQEPAEVKSSGSTGSASSFGGCNDTTDFVKVSWIKGDLIF